MAFADLIILKLSHIEGKLMKLGKAWKGKKERGCSGGGTREDGDRERRGGFISEGRDEGKVY